MNTNKKRTYAYLGVKDKNGLYAGASAGTKGVKTYFGYADKYVQARIVHNSSTGTTIPRLRLR